MLSNPVLQIALKTIKHTLKGGLLLRKGHIPQAGEGGRENYLVVGVAASHDARGDHYIINPTPTLHRKEGRRERRKGEGKGKGRKRERKGRVKEGGRRGRKREGEEEKEGKERQNAR